MRWSQRAPAPTPPPATVSNIELVPDPRKVSHEKSQVPSKAPWTRVSPAASLSAPFTNAPATSFTPSSRVVNRGWFLAKRSKSPKACLNQLRKWSAAPPSAPPSRPTTAPKAADLPTSFQSIPSGRRPFGFRAICASRTARVCRASSRAPVRLGARWVVRSSRSTTRSTASLLRARASAICDRDVPPVIAARAASSASSRSSATISAMISHLACWMFREWSTWPRAMSSS
ncbi:hypothetical protein CP968_32830 [Streptomyces subrutilus]|uniref:Uncharacterized protein n=1 Tax=Streptomyces subrutilus TaxID=36818 RepID=A0A5P2UU43_9ACTN|nr:hypothetical protein CP968_32830 [Streptomyces subrutilus]